MHCSRPLYTNSALGHPKNQTVQFDLALQGSMGVPLGAGNVVLLGMQQLEPKWWVQSGAGECKGSHPAQPIHQTTVVLHCSYPVAVHMPSIGVYIYIYLDGTH